VSTPKTDLRQWAALLAALLVAGCVGGCRREPTTRPVTTQVVVPGFDQYGGLTALPSPNPATGFFRIEKIGNRWVLVDPDNNAYFSLGVAVVSSTPGQDPDGRTYGDYTSAKYGGSSSVWASQTKLRMLSWGFNALGMFESSYVRSYGSFGRQPNPPLMPHFNLHVGFAKKSLANDPPLVSEPVKNFLWDGQNAFAIFPDVFDPKFRAFAFAAVTQNINSTTGGLATELTSPWVLGYVTDETDDLRGFGAVAVHRHIGWAAVAAMPTQTTAQVRYRTVTYSDTTVYTKLALRDFLKARYNNDLSALNAAWNSTYTSWESAGGWGQGTGLLDEKGTHPWMGDRTTLGGETLSMQTDLNDFLFQIARR